MKENLICNKRRSKWNTKSKSRTENGPRKRQKSKYAQYAYNGPANPSTIFNENS